MNNSVDNNPSNDKHTKRVPHMTNSRTIKDSCKAFSIDGVITTFARCETDEPEHCRFTLMFPNVRLCTHPLAQEIVERTRKAS